MQIAGVIGSWRWRTSNRSRSSTRLIRKNDRGLSTMFGSDPFAGTITDLPTGITFAGGSPCRPTRGCRARVNWPGGSFPMSSCTSWPRGKTYRVAAVQLAAQFDAPGTALGLATPDPAVQARLREIVRSFSR